VYFAWEPQAGPPPVWGFLFKISILYFTPVGDFLFSSLSLSWVHKENPMDNFLAYPHEQKPPSEQKGEFQSMAKFRRALRREDQEILDDLFRSAVQHWPLQSLADHTTPLEFMLLTMLLEQEKAIERLRIQISKLTGSPVHPPFP
jgi:hypothetical protein